MLRQPPSPPAGWTWRQGLALLALLAGAGWLLWTSIDRTSRPEPLLVAIAETDPPQVSFSDDLPAAADAGVMGLARGDCQTAAASFRTARRGAPEVARLWVLEGAALVCAGRPAEARDVLEDSAAQADPNRQVWWFLAQACLMEGDADCATISLNRVLLEDGRHRRRAEEQLARLRDAQLQLSRR